MLVPFESISPSSRIWIYQSNKKFNEADKSIIVKSLNEFAERWTAHGQPLKASYTIFYDQFIVLAADEAFHATSGCSIDESVRAIKEIENLTRHNFFDRKLVGFLRNNEVILIELSNLKQKYQEGIWSAATLAFNNLVNTKVQLENEWLIPAGNTWLKRYIPKEITTASSQ